MKLLLIEGKAYEGGHLCHPVVAAREGLLVVGDKGFDSGLFRQQLEQLGAIHCIPSKLNRRKERKLNQKCYRQRYKMENSFCRQKRWAAARMRRDKVAPFLLLFGLRPTSSGIAMAVDRL